MASTYRGKHNHLARRIGERIIDTALMGGIVAALCYRLGLQGKQSITRLHCRLPSDKRLPRPLRIAFASDFHAGPTTDPHVFINLFCAIEAEQPDLLLLGGDFVSCSASYAKAFTSPLAACKPPLGKFAVFGNHDLWVDDAKLAGMLAEARVTMLVNRNQPLPAPFESVSLCGIDDPWAGTPDPASAFAGAQSTRILLMHAPDGLLLLGGHEFDLAFAGHTHGGQIAKGDGTPIILPHGPLSSTYPYGQYPIAPGSSLIVSRGVGCSTLPLRINADPELVICTLE